jgi:hypothetical protein
VVRRPNRKYEHRRGPSLIVVGALLLLAMIIAVILWNTIGADTGGDEFPLPAADASEADAGASGAGAVEVASAAPPGVDPVDPAGTIAPSVLPADTGEGRGVDAIMTVRSFDPEGDDPSENDDLVPLANDGRLDTAWSTRCYPDADLGGRPVGIAATVLATAPGLLTVDIASASWTIELYATAAEQMPGALAGWGERVGQQSGQAPATYELQMTMPAKHLLVVFREAGPNRACSADLAHAGEIAELHYAARP